MSKYKSNTIGCIGNERRSCLTPLLTQVANKLHYETASDMFYIMYCELGMSSMYIEKVTGFDRNVSRRYIRQMGGKIRMKGGANNTINNSGNIRCKGDDGIERVFTCKYIDTENQICGKARCVKCKTIVMNGKKKINDARLVFKKHTC